MNSAVPDWLRVKLRNDAGDRCGYCHTSSRVTGQPLTFEHIIPISQGGASEEANLWLSCRRCNEFKGAQVTGP
ncbi:MAG: HNH endonuclease [Chloroflexi bacterium]|nr:HNH endonuclease [Chloroflexota bacterium]